MRLGSFTTEMRCPRYVRLCPDSDRRADIEGGPKGASRRHVMGSKRGRQPHSLFSAMIRPVCLLDRQPDTPAQLVGLGPLAAAGSGSILGRWLSARPI